MYINNFCLSLPPSLSLYILSLFWESCKGEQLLQLLDNKRLVEESKGMADKWIWRNIESIVSGNQMESSCYGGGRRGLKVVLV